MELIKKIHKYDITEKPVESEYLYTFSTYLKVYFFKKLNFLVYLNGECIGKFCTKQSCFLIDTAKFFFAKSFSYGCSKSKSFPNWKSELFCVC